jgi:glycosyltransferase involved in cell wall biosynthesis
MSDAYTALLKELNFSTREGTGTAGTAGTAGTSGSCWPLASEAPRLQIVELPTAAPVAPMAPSVPLEKDRLCLNMIVKNESKIIERLLGSVLSIVDTYCICDTGSTDDTADIIRRYMAAAGKPGEVYVEPFQNFGYNRTHALERAAKWGDYVLLLDADMKLVIEPGFDKAVLKEKGYAILQKNGSLEYYNTRIVKTGIGVKCVGPTHEYYDFPGGGGQNKLGLLWINDIGDGGCKSDKYERDIRLLKAALETEPKNDRYHFYLAQSYNHSGRKEEAYEMYKKRVHLGGWVEEVFYAAMEAGHMAKALGRTEEAIYWWMEAYSKHPKRTESLYEITKHYREVGKHTLAQIFCSIGLATPFPKDDVLFIKKDVYDFLFDYEQSILSFYTGKQVDHYRYIHLLEKNYARDNVLSNYKFYVKKLKDLSGAVVHDFGGQETKKIMGRDDTFTSSSPCILACSEGYLMNVRYVNYKIRPDGGYDFKHGDGKITTLNKVYWLNRNLKTLKTQWIDQVQDESLRYQGVEDVKVFSHCGDLLFLGTVEHPANGRVTVGHGLYDLSKDRLLSKAFDSPYNRGCEKNWSYFHDAEGNLRVVYEWKPLTIGTVNGDGLSILRRDDAVPAILKEVRGSSHGSLLGDEVWFLCHLVQYSTPRYYYHMIVVLDAKTFAFKRHSILFKFHGDCIEYSLGFVLEAERALFSFSQMDRTSKVLVLPRDVFMRELFPGTSGSH